MTATRVSGVLAALVLVVATVGRAAAAPASAAPDDRILPLSLYQTEKARTLAQRHERALRDLNTEIYHCLPWVDVSKHSIGFFKPKGATDDDRYLSIRLYVDQQPSPEFDRLTIAERASAMFSRYVGPMLRRMARHAELVNDDVIGGYSVIVEWLKGIPASSKERPVHQTIAAFIEKVDADEYLSGRVRTRELASRARVLAFDGEEALGRVAVAGWEDNFVATYKLKGYEPDPTVTCFR
ncbi:MAG: hypothetical protein DMD81_08785 [Candidatus Rokuibacteriota bacterium]|nr:MAG: hypothetical protein DMD81_08785 [Candidatus Rokubacteria bacterium]